MAYMKIHSYILSANQPASPPAARETGIAGGRSWFPAAARGQKPETILPAGLHYCWNFFRAEYNASEV